MAFSALALHDHPEYRQKLQEDEGLIKPFVQEVRRYYPFAPFIGARVREDFEWKGYHFPEGRLVVMDLYGTNHDEQIWDRPDEFRPERFYDWDGSPFNFIPQGGGDYDTGHRCAGEWLTIGQMEVTLKFLTQQIEYEVPEQDLEIKLTRIPARPKSGFIIRNARKIEH